jgi:hypothetical protein
MVGEILQTVERLPMSAVATGVKGKGDIRDFLGIDLL